ncbi:hypothetical protein HHL28_05480 [Aerophototrophica crusticola]|uniref:Flagellar basal-body protein FlbY n=1 Tax=Aerophototrophica crusticola TaxID=1709002 RepID=A0A858R5H1_9PROT|nr:hypothetical protein HHL28_05480 [Rhodospirillaceae bacterium B3]
MTAALARAEGLIDAMDRLAGLFEEENRIVRSRNLKQLGEVAEKKGILLRAYEDAVRTVRLDVEGFKALDPEMKERLHGTGRRFAELAAENAGIVQAATQAAQAVVDTLVASIKQVRADDGPYSSRATLGVQDPYGRKTTRPSSLNKTL